MLIHFVLKLMLIHFVLKLMLIIISRVIINENMQCLRAVVVPVRYYINYFSPESIVSFSFKNVVVARLQTVYVFSFQM